MIASSKGNVLRLSGSLVKNEWLTIKAAANLMLQDHQNGIIIDCGELEDVSSAGTLTFLDAMKDIGAGGSRIIVCNLPENVLEVVRKVPGVRSQLPIAETLEKARVSLKLQEETEIEPENQSGSQGAMIVLLAEGVDMQFSGTAAIRVARDLRIPIHLLYLLEVPRELPLGTPLVEEEAAARDAMREVSAQVKRGSTMPVTSHVERVRDLSNGALQMIDKYNAGQILVSSLPGSRGSEKIVGLMNVLLERAPCTVLLARNALKAQSK